MISIWGFAAAKRERECFKKELELLLVVQKDQGMGNR